MSPVAKRAHIAPFEVMEVFCEAAELRAQGKDILHLSLGQPGRRMPQAVLDALSRTLQADALGYTEARGLPALRQRIARHYHMRYGVTVSPERIFVTVGSSAATFLTLLCAFDAGAQVALARPCYPAYPNMLRATNLETVFLDTDEVSAFQPTLAQLKAMPKPPQGLIIASPSNPAGTVMPPQDLQEIAQWCSQTGTRLISDEIYHGVTYGDAVAHTALAYSDEAFVVNSFSKYYLMPGWRLGWAVVPERFCRSFESLVQSFFISPPAISQHAALHIFDHLDALDAAVQAYAINRDMLLSTLRDMGMRNLNQADGAFYLYANVSGISHDSREFCRRMLHEIGVCAVPGLDFDTQRGHQYVRFSYSGETSVIAEACARLKAWVR
ncbi:MAG: aminotransferase class I/II-fold pyridoxal phosphate-dependent enzyme [Rickettsiales bacterium]|nr:aminotransferase class I/II-fold pyridoxal phosphate-dependent enzyme [Rickettsiales bacterium]